jgi:competence protein ComEC
VREISPLRQRFPLGGVLIAAIVGILLASSLGATWVLLFSLLTLSLLLLPLWKQGGMVLAFTVAVFSLLQLWAWNEAPARKLALWLEAHPQEFSVEGVVIAEPKSSLSGSLSFPLQVERIATLDEEFSSIKPSLPVQVRWPMMSKTQAPSYGDRVSFQAIPTSPPPPRNPGEFDYHNWLERHGIYSEFRIDPSEPGKIISSGHGNPLMGWAIMARHRMEAILSTDLEGAARELSVIKGITLGVTEDAPEGFIDEFRFTGTMHLFAVSGLHVGMLAVMIWFLLMAFRLPRSWAVGIIIPLLFFYVAVTGLKSGSIRSAIMVSLLLCGSVLYRRAPLLNTLAAAALLQLALDTNALFSAGWQFSYSVVFAIIALTPPLERRLCHLYEPDPFIPPRLLTPAERFGFAAWKYFCGLLAVSTAAWVGSLIPTIAYFHLISFSAIGANLLAVPLAFVVLALGALSLLAGSFSLWVAGAFNNANWLVAKLLLLVIQGSSLLPGGHWFIGPPAKPYPVITIFDLGGAPCSVVQSGRSFALLNAGRKRDTHRTILPFLETRGANSIQEILITKPDAAHLGGVPEIARELRIAHLDYSSENPRSPVAKRVLSAFGESKASCAEGSPKQLLPGVTAEVLNLGEGEMGVRLYCPAASILYLPRLTPESAKQLLSRSWPECRILIMPLGGVELVSTLQLLRKIAPKVIISPVDHLSRDGIPSPEWDRLLELEGMEFLRQDRTGAVILEADPKGVKVLPFVPGKDRDGSDRSGGR